MTVSDCTSPIEQRAAVELRFDGSQLTGTVMAYGDVARGPKGPERFEPYPWEATDAPLVLQHDRERVIVDRPDYIESRSLLELRADLRPDSAEAELVRRRTLRGLSVGFVALEERMVAGVRVVSKAFLDHVGLVDRPAFSRSLVEVRQEFERAWLTGEVRYDAPLQCTCQGGGCDSVEFSPGAFDDLGEGRRDLLAVGGQGFASVLGSLRRGSLITEVTDQGLRVGLTNPATEAARQVVEAGRLADIYVRPVIDVDASDFTDEGTVRRFTRGVGLGASGQGHAERCGPYPGPDRGCGSTTEATVAVMLTVAQLAAALRVGDSPEETAEMTRLLGYGTEAVTRFAPDAPAVVLDEALIRLAGYIYDQPERSRSVQYANALRNSGAGSILEPYRVHRAGIVGGDQVIAGG